MLIFENLTHVIRGPFINDVLQVRWESYQVLSPTKDFNIGMHFADTRNEGEKNSKLLVRQFLNNVT